MTNFADFEKILAAANKELDNLKAKSKEIQEEIDIIDQDRYQVVYNYFNNLLQIIKRNKICSNILYIPTPIVYPRGKYYYVIRIAQGSEDRTVHTYHDTRIYYPELGIHTSNRPNVYYNPDINTDEQYGWHRWMGLREDYLTTVRHGDPDFLDELVNHFEEYEAEITSNFKEAITKQVAYNLKQAEVDVRNKVATLINK